MVVGGGLAGLAAGAALAQRGRAVTILESRGRLGGRAGSFVDAATGQVIDACQHVGMGCCTNLTHFFHTLGVDNLLAPQPELIFRTLDGRASRFRADPWPAPFHLARAFQGLHYLSLRDKLAIAWGLLCLRATDADCDPPFADWLREHGQTPRAVDAFWGLVLVSALNESVDRIGLKYARKVFVDGFLRHRDAFVVQLPTVPLDRLYGDELRDWFDRHGATILLNAPVRHVRIAAGRCDGVVLRDSSAITADRVVLAVPFERVADIVPPESLPARHPLTAAGRLKASPITSVHLWLDRPVIDTPHEVIVDGLCQWLFQRGEVAPGEYYLQVVISAARALAGWGHEEIERRVVDELKTIYPAARSAVKRRSRVVTEKAATFSAVPGVDRFRPGPDTGIPGLFVAGDWTATGWPATMEGAVRSGYRAAEAVTGETIVRPDL